MTSKTPAPTLPMPRVITDIPLHNLTVSKLNVRRHNGRDIKSLAASIARNGLIYPLLVRATDTPDAYEVIAGKRRLLALQCLAKAGAAPMAGEPPVAAEPPVAPCLVLADTDDATAIETSLIENTERLPMDELDAYEAFAKLIREGRSQAEIASTFSVSIAAVRKRLALANLIAEIKQRYRQGDIETRALEALTLGSKERQRTYLKLIDDADQSAPPLWQLKIWMLGGAAIDASCALFPLDSYAAPITSDLFGDTRYLTDPEEFWAKQNGAVAALAEDFKAKGWSDVHVLAPDEPFHAYQLTPTTKANGGAVYIKLNPDGHVSIEKGLLARADARRAERAHKATSRLTSQRAAEQTGLNDDRIQEPDHRPEMTSALNNLVDLVRHSTVCAALLKKPKLALRLAVAHMIAGAPTWNLSREPRTPTTPEVGKAAATVVAETLRADGLARSLTLLGLADDPEAASPLLNRYDPKITVATVFEKLKGLSDADVAHILATVMAETLPLASPVIDSLGAELGLTAEPWAEPDRAAAEATIFSFVRGRSLIASIAADLFGTAQAPALCHGTVAQAKAKLAAGLRLKHRTFVPRWLEFPQRRYLAGPPARADVASPSEMEAAE